MNRDILICMYFTSFVSVHKSQFILNEYTIVDVCSIAEDIYFERMSLDYSTALRKQRICQMIPPSFTIH